METSNTEPPISLQIVLRKFQALSYEVNKKSIMDVFDQMVYDQRRLGFVGLILDPRTIYQDHRREIGL